MRGTSAQNATKPYRNANVLRGTKVGAAQHRLITQLVAAHFGLGDAKAKLHQYSKVAEMLRKVAQKRNADSKKKTRNPENGGIRVAYVWCTFVVSFSEI